MKDYSYDYIDDENVTFCNQTRHQVIPELFLEKIGVLTSISVGTLISNIAILIAILTSQSKLSRMNYFLVHLSLADILTVLFSLIPEIAWTFTIPFFYGGDPTCKVVKFLQMLGPYLSSFLLCVTSIDRYRAICQPFKPKETDKFVKIAWILALCCCLPQTLVFRETKYEICHLGEWVAVDSCLTYFPDWMNNYGQAVYTLYFSFAFFFIPLFILILTNCLICHKIWTSSSNTPSRVQGHIGKPDTGREATFVRNGSRMQLSVRNFRSSSEIISRAKIKSVKLTLVIIALYILCSSPFVVSQLLTTLGPHHISEFLKKQQQLLSYLMTLNSLVNPWVYLIFNRNQLFSGSCRNASCNNTMEQILPSVNYNANTDLATASIKRGISKRSTKSQLSGK